MNAVCAVNIAFAAIRNNFAVCCDKLPTPLIDAVTINPVSHHLSSHDKRYFLMNTFLVNYNHDGQRYALELQAIDVADAKARLHSLSYGRVCGEVAIKLPAQLRPLVALICWWRNVAGR